MQNQLVETLTSCIGNIPYVSIIIPFAQGESNIEGRVSINIDELKRPLEFDVVIFPQYPFKSYNSESIKFKNKDYLAYRHVMGDGTICIHTSHCPKITKKIIIDFESLKNWILKYYISQDSDSHYEHLIVPQSTFNDDSFSFVFTEVGYEFQENQFGFVNLSFLSEGKSNDGRVLNYLTQGFVDQYGKDIALCGWSNPYKNIGRPNHGLFVFIGDQPSTHNRFIFQDWADFEDHFEKDFLKFLHQCEKKYLKDKRKGQPIPLFIGYKISESEIHWQVATLEIGDFPIAGVKENKRWYSCLTEGNIKWSLSRNSSYKNFFGRGAFSPNLTNKKILIIGIGAIGSIVARTLTKGGCRKIDFSDYDVKEPENVCRSEYQFISGITDKVQELMDILSHISPFVETGVVNQTYFERVSKVLFKEPGSKELLEGFLNSYDLIFDCSTDNDLMYVLDSLNLDNDLINLSITNHANDLVCAFYPNIYKFVSTQFENVLINDLEDLYNPTGCWDPTFKASYNDINLLVQFALKVINQSYEENSPKNNFVLQTNAKDSFNIEMKQF